MTSILEAMLIIAKKTRLNLATSFPAKLNTPAPQQIIKYKYPCYIDFNSALFAGFRF